VLDLNFVLLLEITLAICIMISDHITSSWVIMSLVKGSELKGRDLTNRVVLSIINSTYFCALLNRPGKSIERSRA
jgi:hypothetical protein